MAAGIQGIPIALFIWLMITQKMIKVDFSSVKIDGRRPAGLLVTLLINWLRFLPKLKKGDQPTLLNQEDWPGMARPRLLS